MSKPDHPLFRSNRTLISHRNGITYFRNPLQFVPPQLQTAYKSVGLLLQKKEGWMTFNCSQCGSGVFLQAYQYTPQTANSLMYQAAKCFQFYKNSSNNLTCNMGCVFEGICMKDCVRQRDLVILVFQENDHSGKYTDGEMALKVLSLFGEYLDEYLSNTNIEEYSRLNNQKAVQIRDQLNKMKLSQDPTSQIRNKLNKQKVTNLIHKTPKRIPYKRIKFNFLTSDCNLDQTKFSERSPSILRSSTGSKTQRNRSRRKKTSLFEGTKVVIDNRPSINPKKIVIAADYQPIIHSRAARPKDEDFKEIEKMKNQILDDLKGAPEKSQKILELKMKEELKQKIDPISQTLNQISALMVGHKIQFQVSMYLLYRLFWVRRVDCLKGLEDTPLWSELYEENKVIQTSLELMLQRLKESKKWQKILKLGKAKIFQGRQSEQKDLVNYALQMGSKDFHLLKQSMQKRKSSENQMRQLYRFGRVMVMACLKDLKDNLKAKGQKFGKDSDSQWQKFLPELSNFLLIFREEQ